MTYWKTNWSAAAINTGYTKCLVGFDLRKSDSLTKVFITSDDESVLFEDICLKYEKLRFSLNMFPNYPERIQGFIKPPNSVILAFDLPLGLAEEIGEAFHISMSPIELVSAKQSWKFLGYDVVDAPSQHSALYGFNWSNDKWFEIQKSVPFKLNTYGIIEDQEMAINSALYFDQLIPAHAPFAPCGIWLKE